jgi:hypothetical protein
MLRAKRARPATEPLSRLGARQAAPHGDPNRRERNASKPMLHAQPRGSSGLCSAISATTAPRLPVRYPGPCCQKRQHLRVQMCVQACLHTLQFASVRCSAVSRDLRLDSISRSSSQLVLDRSARFAGPVLAEGHQRLRVINRGARGPPAPSGLRHGVVGNPDFARIRPQCRRRR